MSLFVFQSVCFFSTCVGFGLFCLPLSSLARERLREETKKERKGKGTEKGREGKGRERKGMKGKERKGKTWPFFAKPCNSISFVQCDVSSVKTHSF